MLKKKLLRVALYAGIILVFGFILLNITFLMYFLYQSAIMALFVHDPSSFRVNSLVSSFTLISFAIIIGLISYAVFHSKWFTIIKATYAVVPFAIMLVLPGIILYRSPLLMLIVGSLFVGGTFIYLYHTRRSWMYYFSLIAITLSLLLATVLNIAI